jgi:dTDP-4-dehydrorhamnose reductase
MVDFNNLKKIITQKKISHIINCIAKTNFSYCEKNKIKAYNANTKIPKIICSIIKKTKIKFIHFSTAAVFLGAKKIQPTLKKICLVPKQPMVLLNS